MSLAALLRKTGAAAAVADPDDTGQNIPETTATLAAQGRAVLEGRQRAAMMPKGTAEPALPRGLARVETARGVFHYDPAQIDAEEIKAASAAARENDVLGLGPASKADVRARAAATGEQIITVTERQPDGVEVKAAIGTPSTITAAAREINARKAPGNIVQIEPVERVLAERQKKPASGGGLAALLASSRTSSAEPEAVRAAGPVPENRPGFFGGVANSARRGVSQAGVAIDGATLGVASGLADDADREPARIAAERQRDARPIYAHTVRTWGEKKAPRIYAIALQKWETRQAEREERLINNARFAEGVRGSLAPAYGQAIGRRIANQETLPASEAFQKWQDAEGTGPALAVLARHPLEVIANLAAESLTASAPALAAGAVGAAGGPVGVAAGTGIGSFATEYGSKIVEELQAAGVDFNEPATLAALMEDGERFASIRAKATARGVPVALFDAVSAGIAGKLITAPTRGGLRKLAAGAGEVGIQAGLGGAGEVTGSIAAGDEIDGKDVLASVIGEVGPGSVEIASGALRNRSAPSEAASRRGLARLLAETNATEANTSAQATPKAEAMPATTDTTTTPAEPITPVAPAPSTAKTPAGNPADIVAAQIEARPLEDFRSREAIAAEGLTGPDVDVVSQLVRYGDATRPEASDPAATPEAFDAYAERMRARFGERVTPYLAPAWESIANGERVGDLNGAASNPLALESTARRALTYGRLFFEGSADVLRRSGLRSLASAVEQHTDLTDRNVATAWAPFRTVLAPFKGLRGLARRAEFKTALAEFETYQLAREDGRTAEAAQILANASPAARDLVAATARAMEITGAQNRRLGVRVVDVISKADTIKAALKRAGFPSITDKRTIETLLSPEQNREAYAALKDELGESIDSLTKALTEESAKAGQTIIRPIGELGAAYFPRVVRPEIADVLTDPSSNPARWRKMQDELLEAGLIKDRAQAIEFLRAAVPEDADTISRGDRFAPLAVARGARLPSSWLRHDFNVVGKYLTRWAERAAQIEAFGQKIGPDDLDAFDYAQRATNNNSLADYIAKTRAAAYRVTRVPPRIRGALGNITAATTGLLMGNPYSTARNLIGGVAQTVNQLGPVRAFAELREAFRSAAHADAEAVGVLKGDVADLLFQGEGSASVRGLAGLALRVNGFNAVENYVRAHGMITARAFLRDALALRRDRPRSRRALQATAFIQRNGLNIEKLDAENLSGPETERFLRSTVRDVQGSYRYSQTPLFTQTPVGRLLFQMQRWGMMATRYHVKHTLAPALIGDVVTVSNPDGTTSRRRVRTIAPLLRSPLVAMAAGVSTYALREAAFGIDRTDQTWEEVFNALSEDEQRGLELALGRMVNDITMGGTYGAVSSMADTLRWAIKTSKPRSPVQPPSISLALEIVALGRKAQAQGDLSAQDLRAFAGRMNTGYKYHSALAHSIADKVGSEWEAARRHRAEQDRRLARHVGRRFAEAQGYPAPTPPPDAPRGSRRAVLYDTLEDALHEGDADTARAVADEALDGIRTDKLRAKIRQQVRAAVLTRMPMRPGGLGTAASREDFREWMGRNLPASQREQINAAQSRFITTAVRAGILSESAFDTYTEDEEDAEE